MKKLKALSKSQKLAKLESIIRDEKYPTREYLAKKLDCTGRTINRLIEEMKDDNYPIAFNRKENGYYFTQKHSGVSPICIQNKDLAYLFITQKILEQYDGTPLFDELTVTLRKMAEYMNPGIESIYKWVDTNVSFIKDPCPEIDQKIWQTVLNALKRKKLINILYDKPSADRLEEKSLKIYHMAFHNNNWYISAYDINDSKIKTYAISRIRSAKIVPKVKPYTIPADYNPEEQFYHGAFGKDLDKIVKLYVSPKQAYYIKERKWHEDQQITDLPDGGIEISFPIGNYYEIKRWILGQGRHVKVLAPDELRIQVEEELQAALGLYT